jgi:hypothetical protein
MGMFDSKSQKEADLMQGRLTDIFDGSKNFLSRAINVEHADKEVDAGIAKRDSDLQKMKDEIGAQIELLKKDVSDVRNDILSLKHNLKLSINTLKTVARLREVEQVNTRIKRFSPFRKATKEQAERIIKEAFIAEK